ncbi:MAG TPA: STAS domain-containing protein [Solirubrobacteraceae bacterium]|jgi:anti-sigma B factor antagonist
MNAGTPVPGSLSISSETDQDTVHITLQGELDLASAPQMQEHLRAAGDSAPARVVVDLARLAFIDSTGLRVLLQADARARELGYELVLRPGEPSVQRVFEVTGATDMLRFEHAPEG